MANNETALIAPKDRMAQIENALSKKTDLFKVVTHVAARQYLTPERLIKLAVHAAARNPKLRECTNESLIYAVLVAAELGLEIATPLDHAYLVPLKNKHNGNRLEAQLWPGYKGLCHLALRSGLVSVVNARSVYYSDEFEVEYGTNEFIRHVPNLDGMQGWDELRCTYSVIRMRDGNLKFVVVPKAKLQKLQAAARTQDFWGATKFAVEMSEKTAVRHNIKLCDLSGEAAVGAQIQAYAEDVRPLNYGQVLSNDASLELMADDGNLYEADPTDAVDAEEEAPGRESITVADEKADGIMAQMQAAKPLTATEPKAEATAPAPDSNAASAKPAAARSKKKGTAEASVLPLVPNDGDGIGVDFAESFKADLRSLIEERGWTLAEALAEWNLTDADLGAVAPGQAEAYYTAASQLPDRSGQA